MEKTIVNRRKKQERNTQAFSEKETKFSNIIIKIAEK